MHLEEEVQFDEGAVHHGPVLQHVGTDSGNLKCYERSGASVSLRSCHIALMSVCCADRGGYHIFSPLNNGILTIEFYLSVRAFCSCKALLIVNFVTDALQFLGVACK